MTNKQKTEKASAETLIGIQFEIHRSARKLIAAVMQHETLKFQCCFILNIDDAFFCRLLPLSSDAAFLFAGLLLQTNGFLFVLSEWQCQILRLTFDDTLRCTLHSPPLFRTAAPGIYYSRCSAAPSGRAFSVS